MLPFPLKRGVFTPRNPRRLLNPSVLKYSNDPTNRVQPNLLSVKMILRLSTLYRRHHQFSYQRSISPVSLRNQRLDLFYRVFRFLSPIAVFLARLTKTVRFILYRKTPHKIKKLRILFPGVRFVASLLQILNYADSIPYFRRLAFWQIPGNTRHQRTYLYSLFAVNYSRRKLVLSSAYIYITLFALHFLKNYFFLSVIAAAITLRYVAMSGVSNIANPFCIVTLPSKNPPKDSYACTKSEVPIFLAMFPLGHDA